MSDSVNTPTIDPPRVEPEQKNKMFIVQILNEMHNVFNKSTPDKPKNAEGECKSEPPSPVSNDDNSSVVFEAQRVEEDEDEQREKADCVPEGSAGGQPVEAGSMTEPFPETAVLPPVTDSADDPPSACDPAVEVQLPPEPHTVTDIIEVVPSVPEVVPLVSEVVQPSEATDSEENSFSQETLAEPLADEVNCDIAGPSTPNAGSDSDQFHEVPSGVSEESDVGVVEERHEAPKKRPVGRPSKADSLARNATLLSQVPQPEEASEKRNRRSLRSADKGEQDTAVKRSSRRMSKDYNRESVLQNAIARKEKSLNSFSEEKPRRSTRLSEDPKAPTPSHRSPKPKALRNATSADEASSPNGDPVNDSPSRGTKHTIYGDQDDTASDVSSRSIKKLRTLESPLKTSAKLSSKESLLADEDSASSWQAHPPSDPSLDKGSDSSSKFIQENENNERKLISSEAISFMADSSAPKKDESSTSMNVVEGSEPPNMTEESQLPPMSAATALLCECETLTSMYTKDSPNQLCRALDFYENRLVKCANDVGEVPLLRCCKTKPFQALCLIHFERMIRHNACPSCGSFCTQGLVNICENKHLFHKDCELKMDDCSVCPHCGTESYRLYKIQLQNHRYPLFLPSTKPLNKLPVAKMAITRHKVESDKGIETDLSEIVPSAQLTLPSGKVISVFGIPMPERDRLIRLLEKTVPSDDVRHTYRSLYQSAKTGDAEKVLAMLGSGISPNQVSMNPLMGAAREGHLLVAHLLVQAGANLETLDKNQFTPLMLAVMNKHNSIVKYLVKSGADVGFKGADGMTALHLAAKEGNLEACHYILSQANLPASFIDTVDDGRWTALVWAAENCHSKVVRYLLEKRADPQIRDAEMNIALHWSAFAGSMEITEDLLNYGCNINLSNTHGDTPLHIAARQGADSCVVLLLARGANVEVMNKAGQLPRDCVINKDSYCFTAIDLNMTIKKSVASCSFYPRILCNDVSGGREENPIQCVNAIDDDPVPTDYTYVTENCFTSNVTIDRRISSLMFCKCEDSCSGNSCMCSKISRGCWYDNVGKLLPEFNFEDPPILFECNPACGCHVLTCKNRVVQKGLKSRLQLVKTKNKSWGVITLKEIPKGTYVCEYIGEIISDLEADTRKDDSYLFDLDNAESETYCLDARKYGNICRFINHSCRPNLSPVKIYFQHQDLHFPRIAMFASRDIAANEELGFDYGEKFWIIKCKSFTCHCGEPTCRYSESTIQQTLDKYQQKLRELDEMSDSM